MSVVTGYSSQIGQIGKVLPHSRKQPLCKQGAAVIDPVMLYSLELAATIEQKQGTLSAEGKFQRKFCLLIVFGHLRRHQRYRNAVQRRRVSSRIPESDGIGSSLQLDRNYNASGQAKAAAV